MRYVSSGLFAALCLCVVGCGGGSGGGGGPDGGDGDAGSLPDGGGAGSAVDVQGAKRYSGAATQAPDLIAIDGSQNVWIGSQAFATIMRLEPATATANCSSGCTAVTMPTNNLAGLAIDTAGSIWFAGAAGHVGSPSSSNVAVASINPGTLSATSVFPNSTELSSDLTLYGQAEAGPLAFESSGQLVVGGNAVFNANGTLNYSLVLTAIGADGTLLTSFAVPAAAVSNQWMPEAIAVDSAGTVWANFGNNLLVKYPAAGGGPVSFVLPGGVFPLLKMAIDNSGNAWVLTTDVQGSSSTTGTGVLEIAVDAPADCSTGCTAFASPSQLPFPKDLAVDGANDVWVAGNVVLSDLGYDGIGVTRIQTGAAADCSTGCKTFVSSALLNTSNASPGGLAIDGSGNVWVESYFDNSVVELPGIAHSTVTPIAAQPR